MKQLGLGFGFIILSHFLSAQALIVKPEALEDEIITFESHFNEAFIKRNKIKRITGSHAMKKPLEPIKELGKNYWYDFNENGQVIAQYETFFRGNKKLDTILTQFEYEKGNLVLKRKSDALGYFSHVYTYDTSHQLISFRYCRDENLNAKKEAFKLGRRIEVFSERYDYLIPKPEYHTRYTYNDLGKLYQNHVFHYNAEKQLVKMEHEMTMTGDKTLTEFAYDFYGRVISKTQWNGVDSSKTNRIEYQYDEVGNLLREKIWEGQNHLKTKEFVYDGQMLPSAQLTKMEDTEIIHIIKFKFEFYPVVP